MGSCITDGQFLGHLWIQSYHVAGPSTRVVEGGLGMSSSEIGHLDLTMRSELC